jgi:hypothetical protein
MFLPTGELQKTGRAQLAVALRPYFVVEMIAFDAGGKVTNSGEIIPYRPLPSCA